MAKRWLHALVRLHPRRWRQRFGAETSSLIDDLLGEGESSINIGLDLLGSACSVRARRLTSSKLAPPGIASLAIVSALCIAALLQTSSLQPVSLKPGQLNPELVRETRAHRNDHANQVHWSTFMRDGKQCHVGTEKDHGFDPKGPLITSTLTYCIPITSP